MKLTNSPIATADLNMLRALDALLEAASVSAAARRLGITPAAASNSLRRLREYFGDPLLVRSGSKMERTSLGERLREPAYEAMRAAAAALTVGPAFEPRQSVGSFRVATSDHVDAVWLEPLRAWLAREAPGLEIVLLPYSNASGEQAAAGEIDLVIAPRTRLPENVRAVRFAEEPYALVIRAGHPRARRRIDLACFVELGHLVVSPVGDASPTSVDRALAALGHHRRVLRRVTSFSSGLLIVATSDLVGVVPRSFATVHAPRLGLRVRDLPLEVPAANLYMAWSARRHDDSLHTFVRRALSTMARRGRGR